MTFATDSHSVTIADPQSDEALLPVWRAPQDGGKTTVRGARIVPDVTLAAGTANGYTLRLFKAGQSGTAVSGTITAELGATVGGTFPGWVAGTPVDFVITDGELDSGEWLAVAYDETGTVAPLNSILSFDTSRGPATL